MSLSGLAGRSSFSVGGLTRGPDGTEGMTTALSPRAGCIPFSCLEYYNRVFPRVWTEGLAPEPFSGFSGLWLTLSHATSIPRSPACRWLVMRLLGLVLSLSYKHTHRFCLLWRTPVRELIQNFQGGWEACLLEEEQTWGDDKFF
jgi:hypothetical protein